MTHENDHYVDLKRLANRLSLSPRSIRERVNDSAAPLPAYRVGGKLLFNWEEVALWIEKHRIKPIDVDDLTRQTIEELRLRR